MNSKALLFLVVVFLSGNISNSIAHSNLHPEFILPEGEWYTYTTEDGVATIKFPSKPAVEVTEGEDATTAKISVQEGDLTYFFGYTTHNQTLEEYEELAKVSLDAFNAQVKGEIVSQEAYKYKKHKGIDAKIKLETQGAIIQYRVILIDQSQYQIIVIGPDRDFEKEMSKFYKSFKVN